MARVPRHFCFRAATNFIAPPCSWRDDGSPSLARPKLQPNSLWRQRNPACKLALNQSGGTMRLPSRFKTILLASAVVVVSFAVSLKALDWLSPRAPVNKPALVE